jgi:hypothetical protein
MPIPSLHSWVPLEGATVVTSGHKVPLQHRKVLAAVKADDVFRGNRLPYGDGRFRF